MERELWSVLMVAVRDVDRHFKDTSFCTFSTALIVRVLLWSALWNKPVYWACREDAWDHRTRPDRLPSQSTLSRRPRSEPFKLFMEKLTRRLDGRDGGVDQLVRVIDGKPMFVARHSSDPDATYGRGAGASHKGYKLHAVWGSGRVPCVWELRGMAESEKLVAQELLPRLTGGGYLLGDAFFDSNPLHRVADARGIQLVAPRKRTHRGKGLGKRGHAPGRLRSLMLTEPPPGHGGFGRALRGERRKIETRFANLTSFGAGLTHPPAWVRRTHRVKTWVHAKLLINAARIIRLERRKTA